MKTTNRKQSKIKTDLIIGDIHLDIKGGDNNFKLYQDLFFQQVLEFIKNNHIRYIIFLGDIFTNKQNINFEIMDYALETFNSLSKHVDKIFVINGNHVIYYKNSYDIDSVKLVFKNRTNLKNVEIFNEYHVQDNYLFLNWKNTREEYINLLKKIPNKKEIEYIFGHFELFGFMKSRFVTNNHKNATKKEDFFKLFPNLKKVISGHYHTQQEYGNVYYPGVPYQMAWSDYGMELGFITLNDRDEIDFYQNEYEIYEHIDVKNEEIIINYEIPDIKYQKYYKITYNNPQLNHIVEEFVQKLEERGHKVSLINDFDLFDDEESDNDVKDEDLKLESSKSQKNSVEMNLEGIFKDYIYGLNMESEELDVLYDRFMILYKETKLEVIQNLEI